MAWNIEYYNDKVAKIILKMPSGLLARYIHITDMIRLKEVLKNEP